MSKTIRAALAVVLGIAAIVLGCLPLVGHSSLHEFLIFMGIVMILLGGIELT